MCESTVVCLTSYGARGAFSEKNGVNKTTNSENTFKTGHSSTIGDPLTFHVMRKSKHTSSYRAQSLFLGLGALVRPGVNF